MSQAVKAALLQTRVRPSLEEALEAAGRLAGGAARRGAEVLCFPEYFFRLPYREPCAEFSRTTERPVREFYARVSEAHGVLVAGNVISRGRNLGVLYRDGALVGTQPKVHPTVLERRWSIRPGSGLRRWKISGFTAGMLVCADILHPETAARLWGADLVFNPVVSPRRPGDETAEARRAMYVARAFDIGGFVLKAGLVAPGFAGRSLAAAPWGVVAAAGSEDREEALVADLDLGRLRRAREQIGRLKGRDTTRGPRA